jgi:hypothetical protein
VALNVGTWSAHVDDAAGEGALRSLRRRHPRAGPADAVRSLVVLAESDDELAAVLGTVRGLAGPGPCRTVAVRLDGVWESAVAAALGLRC